MIINQLMIINWLLIDEIKNKRDNHKKKHKTTKEVKLKKKNFLHARKGVGGSKKTYLVLPLALIDQFSLDRCHQHVSIIQAIIMHTNMNKE